MGYAKPTRRVLNFQARRSTRARKIDSGLRAPIAKTESQWLAQPNRFDIPQVDTPKKPEEITRITFEPLSTSRSQFRANLNAHRLYGNTH